MKNLIISNYWKINRVPSSQTVLNLAIGEYLQQGFSFAPESYFGNLAKLILIKYISPTEIHVRDYANLGIENFEEIISYPPHYGLLRLNYEHKLRMEEAEIINDYLREEEWIRNRVEEDRRKWENLRK